LGFEKWEKTNYPGKSPSSLVRNMDGKFCFLIMNWKVMFQRLGHPSEVAGGSYSHSWKNESPFVHHSY
jgi:hypothetical protein